MLPNTALDMVPSRGHFPSRRKGEHLPVGDGKARENPSENLFFFGLCTYTYFVILTRVKPVDENSWPQEALSDFQIL